MASAERGQVNAATGSGATSGAPHIQPSRDEKRKHIKPSGDEEGNSAETRMVRLKDGCSESLLEVGVGRTLTWESDEAAAPPSEGGGAASSLTPLEEGPEREGAAVPPKRAKRWGIHTAR